MNKATFFVKNVLDLLWGHFFAQSDYLEGVNFSALQRVVQRFALACSVLLLTASLVSIVVVCRRFFEREKAGLEYSAEVSLANECADLKHLQRRLQRFGPYLLKWPLDLLLQGVFRDQTRGRFRLGILVFFGAARLALSFLLDFDSYLGLRVLERRVHPRSLQNYFVVTLATITRLLAASESCVAHLGCVLGLVCDAATYAVLRLAGCDYQV